LWSHVYKRCTCHWLINSLCLSTVSEAIGALPHVTEFFLQDRGTVPEAGEAVAVPSETGGGIPGGGRMFLKSVACS
jgi:hypothetical protein